MRYAIDSRGDKVQVDGRSSLLARRKLRAGIQMYRRGLLIPFLDEIVEKRLLRELLARLARARRAAGG